MSRCSASASCFSRLHISNVKQELDDIKLTVGDYRRCSGGLHRFGKTHVVYNTR